MSKPRISNHCVAIIGSFKQHYDDVLVAIQELNSLNIEVTTPYGSEILQNGIPFVRFSSDDPHYSDEMVQTVTLRKIFKAKVVYVIAPNGYVGRTTCYEIGRVIQKRMPIYFSEHPKDLPIKIPHSHIVSVESLAELIVDGNVKWPFDLQPDCDISSAERILLEY